MAKMLYISSLDTFINTDKVEAFKFRKDGRLEIHFFNHFVTVYDRDEVAKLRKKYIGLKE